MGKNKGIRKVIDETYVGEWPTPFAEISEMPDAQARQLRTRREIDYARAMAGRSKRFFKGHWDMRLADIAVLCNGESSAFSKSFVFPPNDAGLKEPDWATTDDPYEVRPLGQNEPVRRVVLPPNVVALLCRRVLEATPQTFLFGKPAPIVLHKPLGALLNELVGLDEQAVDEYRLMCAEVFDKKNPCDQNKLWRLHSQRSRGPEKDADGISSDPLEHLHSRIAEREIYFLYYETGEFGATAMARRRLMEIEEDATLAIFNANERRPMGTMTHTMVNNILYKAASADDSYNIKLTTIMRVALEFGYPLDYFMCVNYAWGDNPLVYQSPDGQKHIFSGDESRLNEKIRDILGMLLLLEPEQSGILIGEMMYRLRWGTRRP